MEFQMWIVVVCFAHFSSNVTRKNGNVWFHTATRIIWKDLEPKVCIEATKSEIKGCVLAIPHLAFRMTRECGRSMSGHLSTSKTHRLTAGSWRHTLAE